MFPRHPTFSATHAACSQPSPERTDHSLSFLAPSCIIKSLPFACVDTKPAGPSSIHTACKQRNLGHNSGPGCVVCTWEVGSTQQVSVGQEVGSEPTWQGAHIASVVRRRKHGLYLATPLCSVGRRAVIGVPKQDQDSSCSCLEDRSLYAVRGK